MKSPVVERADSRQAREVQIFIDRDATLTPGRGQQTARLVEAERVHGDVRGCGELLDPIFHAHILRVFTRINKSFIIPNKL